MRKNIFFFIFFISLWLGFTQAYAVTVSARVSGSNNDGEEQNPANNTMYLNSTDLEFAYDGGTRQHIGMRFQGLNIPQGTTINSAYIEFEVDETDSGTTNVVIYGQATDDAGTFGNGANNISNRTRTSASVNWSIPAWNVVSSKQNSPDLTPIIQEIIDRAGWNSGNDLAIIIEPGAGCNSSACQRTAESVNGEAANAPLLVIDFSSSSGSCETFRDEFSTQSYSRNDGTVSWAGNWIESGENNGASNGDVNITGGRLHLQDDNNGISRGTDLSAYSTARLSFDYQEVSMANADEYVDLEIRTGGSGSWTFLQRFGGPSDDSGSVSIPIDGYISGNTEIRFFTSSSANMGNGDDFYADNLEIEACANVVPVCSASFRDEFSIVSYGNNNGDTNFTGNWDEYEGTSLTIPEGSPNPSAGHIRITGGQLVMNNYSPESANAPGVERELNLLGFTSATFSFDFTTSGGVDADDSILVQASANGGSSWSLLENISGIGDTTGSKSYDLTPFISSNTKIRLRFNTTINTGACCYGGSPETISFDNINIDASGNCPTVDHYAISHSGIGVTCEAQAVVVTPHDASDIAVAPSSSTTINLSTSIANDGWALRNGSGTFTPPDQYTFDGTETSVEFWLTKTSATTSPHMDIDITDGAATDLDGNATEDPNIEFRDTAFRFYADGINNAIGSQIAGKWSNDTSGIQTLTLRAVQTNTDNGACEARVTGPQTVSMAFECINPGSCKTNNGVTVIDSVIGGAGDALNDNPQGGPIIYSNVGLTFDINGIATWTMNYQDAGQISLHALLNIPASPPDPADILQGSSNTFTTIPAGICVSTPDVDSDCDPANASCSGFKRAGENFNLNIRAVGWETSGEANSGFCSGNAATPNFQLNNIALGHNLLAPVGVPGTIGLNLFDIIATDDGERTLTNQSFSEVGVINFFTPDLTYLGETIASSTSANIGRFYPDHFVLADMQLTNRSDLACASAFSYMEENFSVQYDLEAQNTTGATTVNYINGFAKLDSAVELNYGAVDLSLPTDLTSRLNVGVPVINFVAGRADNISDTLFLSRLATGPDGPFSLSVGIAPVDDDGVSLSGYNLDVSGGGNDHGLVQNTLINYGRMTVGNAYGSELLPLNMAIKAQFFDSLSGSFIGAAIDNCTSFDASVDINLGAATYTASLTAADLGLTGAGNLVGGLASFVLHDNASSTVGPGVTGDVSFIKSVPLYLQYDWDGDLVFTDDPGAKASFGIFGGNSRQIYYRQIYR